MLSLTLFPWGKDRSTIILHLSTWWGLGTSPIGLVWTAGPGGWESSPTSLPASTSSLMYAFTIAVLASADGWFLDLDFRTQLCHLKPMWKPVISPEKMYVAYCWSGWALETWSNYGWWTSGPYTAINIVHTYLEAQEILHIDVLVVDDVCCLQSDSTNPPPWCHRCLDNQHRKQATVTTVLWCTLCLHVCPVHAISNIHMVCGMIYVNNKINAMFWYYYIKHVSMNVTFIKQLVPMPW